MSARVQDLLDEVLKLPDEERSTIAARLLDSLGESKETVERAWRQEVKCRLADLEAGRVELVPWEQARGHIFAKAP